MQNTLTTVDGQVEVVMHGPDSGVPAQPKGCDVVIGARQRAEYSRASVANADVGVGIESGLFNVSCVEPDVKVCSIFDGVRHTIGTSPGLS